MRELGYCDRTREIGRQVARIVEMSRYAHDIRIFKRMASATCDAISPYGTFGELLSASATFPFSRCGLAVVPGALLPQRGYASSSLFQFAVPSSQLSLARQPLGLGGSRLVHTVQSQVLLASAPVSFHPRISSSVAPARALSGGPPAPGDAPRAAEGLRDTARVVGGEEAATASPGNRSAEQQPEPQPQQRQQQEEGWDGEEEPAHVPLDPNVETPGVLFITAGAAISAIVAVLIAGLGILGTFYAGFVINQITKELQAAGAGTKPAATATITTAAEDNNAPTRGRMASTSTQEHQVTPAPGVSVTEAKPPHASSSTSDMAAHQRTPEAGIRSQPAEAKTSSSTPSTSLHGAAVAVNSSPGPQPKRATWRSWLGSGLGWWKRRPDPRETEPHQLPAGPG
ncbi:hypothetical protein Vretimale_994 [Volvox reticuliferus]|uniref:Uncharacterized protein n=1 Tax=Volvox reticuliferus TaxID=1737510 RepID=A0A8J4D874_9CHLO|nr:hypothetical protein Vretifemale_10484 [Volvox reticuliferus]GIL94828.1 hypothetical protein Vretimale_994 [Volvox reticuliferus]